MTDLVNKVCHECGCSDLFAEGIITWDTSLQLWVSDHPEVGSDISCLECDARFDMEAERPLNLKEIAQVAIKKQEATQ